MAEALLYQPQLVGGDGQGTELTFQPLQVVLVHEDNDVQPLPERVAGLHYLEGRCYLMELGQASRGNYDLVIIAGIRQQGR